jgi:hypothetical protein
MRKPGRWKIRSARTRLKPFVGLVMMTGLGLAAAAPPARRSSSEPALAHFRYVGGTEKLKEHCVGKLGLTSSSMVFTCAEGSIIIPYDSILLMQYRADVSRKVRRLKLNWLFKPWRGGGNRNRYFTVVYSARRERRAMVLAVSPHDMRPYLAEIDLKIGRRVEVQDHEKYY